MHRTYAFNQCIGCIGPNVRVRDRLVRVRVRAGLGLVLGLGIGLGLVLFQLDMCTAELFVVRCIRCID